MDAWSTWLTHWVQRRSELFWNSANYCLQVLHWVWLCGLANGYISWRGWVLVLDDQDGSSSDNHLTYAHQERQSSCPGTDALTGTHRDSDNELDHHSHTQLDYWSVKRPHLEGDITPYSAPTPQDDHEVTFKGTRYQYFAAGSQQNLLAVWHKCDSWRKDRRDDRFWPHGWDLIARLPKL